jgi:hypothetical protein
MQTLYYLVITILICIHTNPAGAGQALNIEVTMDFPGDPTDVGKKQDVLGKISSEILSWFTYFSSDGQRELFHWPNRLPSQIRTADIVLTYSSQHRDLAESEEGPVAVVFSPGFDHEKVELFVFLDRLKLSFKEKDRVRDEIRLAFALGVEFYGNVEFLMENAPPGVLGLEPSALNENREKGFQRVLGLMNRRSAQLRSCAPQLARQ